MTRSRIWKPSVFLFFIPMVLPPKALGIGSSCVPLLRIFEDQPNLDQISISNGVRTLIHYETQGNTAGIRSEEPVALQHYEIPLEWIESDIARRTPKEITNSLVFRRDGKKWVRWIINPEDTKWHVKVKNLLKSAGFESDPQQYFVGYPTASRSYIVIDPKSGYPFSVKVSTNNTGGPWVDKQMKLKDAVHARKVSDYIYKMTQNRPLENIVILDEPAMFGLEKLKQAMLVRTLNGLVDTNVSYIPVFSAVHETFGRQLSRKNGSTNPQTFAKKNVVQPMGRALAEFIERFGLVPGGGTHNIIHGQNFLLELDANGAPTGRVVFRDFADGYLWKPWFENTGKNDVATQLGSTRVENYIEICFGLFYGGHASDSPFPTWVKEKNWARWGTSFFQAFEDEFSNRTKIPLHELREVDMAPDYLSFEKVYPSKTDRVVRPSWAQYYERLKSQE